MCKISCRSPAIMEKLKSKRVYLFPEDTAKVIEVWSQHIVKLRESHQNIHIYQRMSAQLESEYNIALTAGEIRTRINNLTKKYRQEQRKITLSGECFSKWKFFQRIHDVLGTFKSKKTVGKVGNLRFETIQLPELDCAASPRSFKSECVETLSDEPSPNCIPPRSFSPPETSTNRPKKRKLLDNHFLEIAEKEQQVMQIYLEKSLENENKVIKLLEQNNKLLCALINK